MAHRIVWSRRAVHDLQAITNYIAADSPAYAAAVMKKIVHQARTLAEFPRAGRKVPEFDDESIREFVVYSYRVIYRVQPDGSSSHDSWQADPAVDEVQKLYRFSRERVHCLILGFTAEYSRSVRKFTAT
jgi:toxin ParE1/3/4